MDECVMYGMRNQMQTGIRQNRKRLFRQEIRSQVIRIVQYRIARHKNRYSLSEIRIADKTDKGSESKTESKGCRVQYLNRLAYKKSAQNKNQRSDGLTYNLLGVYIHRNIKHAKRIMGSEGGLNNY